MKIERRDYPYVEPIKKIEKPYNQPEPSQHGQAPEDRVEISREAQLRIELAQIEAKMKEQVNNPKAYALLERQYREIKQELEEIEL